VLANPDLHLRTRQLDPDWKVCPWCRTPAVAAGPAPGTGRRRAARPADAATAAPSEPATTSEPPAPDGPPR